MLGSGAGSEHQWRRCRYLNPIASPLFAAILDHPAVAPGVGFLGAVLPAPCKPIGFDVLKDHPLERHRWFGPLVLECEDVVAPVTGHRPSRIAALLSTQVWRHCFSPGGRSTPNGPPWCGLHSKMLGDDAATIFVTRDAIVPIGLPCWSSAIHSPTKRRASDIRPTARCRRGRGRRGAGAGVASGHAN